MTYYSFGADESKKSTASAKTTKYEHVLPLLAKLEESEEVDGVLFLLNTVGGKVGDIVDVNAPSGTFRLRIETIEFEE